MADVTIEMTLSTHQARAFLRYQLTQYEVLMAEVWHSDKYRSVPDGMRGPRVLQDYPHIAGLHRTIRALRKQLQEAQA